MNRDGEAPRGVLVYLAESEGSTPREFRYLVFRHFLALRGKPSGTILCSVKPCCFRLGFTVKHYAILRRGGCVTRAVGSMVDVRIAIADDRHGPVLPVHFTSVDPIAVSLSVRRTLRHPLPHLNDSPQSLQ